jgi:hypothetical protein
MNEEKFDLVFSGELVSGFDLTQVKKNIQALFRIDETKVEVLFSGKAIPLRKGLDADSANKYRVAMKKAGARVDVVLSRDPPPAAAAKPAFQPASAAQPVAGNTAKQASGFTTALGAQPVSAPTPRRPIQAPDFGIAAAGISLLRPEERIEVESVDVDVSHLSVVPQLGNLLTQGESERPPGIIVTIPELDLAEVGSDLLLPEERQNQEPVVVDISGLSLGKPGERLAPPSPRPPPAPNVDHIKLKS